MKAVRNEMYPDALGRRNGATWAWAAVIAMAMNLVLFMLMPCLLQRRSAPPAFEQIVPQIQTIRLKRPDSEVRRKNEPPPEPARPRDPMKPAPTLNRPVMMKLTLPFEINPRLPSGPAALALPPMEPTVVGGIDTAETFEAAELDSPLTPLAQVPPVYPMSAKGRGIQGWVKIKFLVDELGHVETVSVLAAEPAGVFDQSVSRCVSGWRFKPGTVEGRPVKAWAETTVRFELQ